MNAMFWLESRFSHGKVIIHFAEPEVERIIRIILC
jgi:hypothetical protein